MNIKKDTIKDGPLNTRSIYTIGSVISKDSTTIKYRQLGNGPGIIIIHGGMQASQNFMKLATELSDKFTVYIPDRRGRGLSGPPGDNYGINKECEDIEALIGKTGAHNVFGLSSGAIISLYAALTLSSVRKIAIYEPPLSIDELNPNQAFLPRYEREISKGNLASAFITIIKGLHLSSLITILPRFILVPLFTKVILGQKNEIMDDDILLKELIPTFHFDNILVNETKGTLENIKNTFENMHANVLLMSGTKSPNLLRSIFKKLQTVLPNAKTIEFSGLNHTGPDNSGSPKLIAHELQLFFGEPQI